MQLRKALHKAGHNTFPKPKGIPKDWGVKITEKNGGIKYFKNEHNYIRVMEGDPTSIYPHKRKPFVVHLKDGNSLDEFGNKVLRNSPEAHICLKEFVLMGE